MSAETPTSPSSETPSTGPAPVSRLAEALQLLAALAALGAAIAIVAPVVRLRLAHPRGHSQTMLAPLAEDGELAPQQTGRGGAQLLVLDSTPEGLVEIDGLEQGETPLSTELHCPEGAEASIVVRSPGCRPFKTKVKCAEGTIVKLTPKLSRR